MTETAQERYPLSSIEPGQVFKCLCGCEALLQRCRCGADWSADVPGECPFCGTDWRKEAA